MTRVLTAMSGGVDSSVAALLLTRAGLDVVGVFLRNGVGDSSRAAAKSCCSASDARDAAAIADRLGIPFYAVDYADEFGAIIDFFAAEYRRGRTPNPCVLCNQRIKFGHLLELADSLGADAVATGHYARVENGALLRAVDDGKDQSYYLFGVSRDALSRVRFPLGGLTKPEVRELARSAGLGTADKPESMEICFVTSGDYRDVVRARGGTGAPGAFVDGDGAVVGHHDGVAGFTVGQRRGLPALGTPHFVREIRPETGEVVVGRREDLARRTCRVAAVHWLVDPPAVGTELACRVQVRARAVAVPSRISLAADAAVEVRFAQEVAAVTPGQAAVFYDGDRVLGGGWID